jgi:hypothetical protein
VVKGHFQAVHGKFSGSGYRTVNVSIPGCRAQRFKICVGNRPEDIQKWIADRKKRFPRQQPPEAANKNAPEAESSKEKIGEKEGLSSLLAGYGSSSGSDDEIVKPKDEGDKKLPPKADPATPKVEEKAGDRGTSTTIETTKAKAIGRPCRYFMKNGSCRSGDACRFSHEIRNNRIPDHHNKKRKRGGHTTSDSLLRKLLSNDMERETTLTMQLLKHIVQQNFFEVKSPPTKETET